MHVSQLPDDTEEFLGKWRGHWPEWRIAQNFVDPTQRDCAEAWFALLQEFVDAGWGGEDATPGVAKLSWWQDELRGWAKGARRHPLGAVLQKIPAPWPALAQGLSVLQAARDAVRGGADGAAIESSVAALRPCADAIAACESVLFAQASAVDAPIDASPTADGDLRGGVVLLALHALWAYTDTPAARRQGRARTLCANWPRSAAMGPRRVYDALIQKRLQAIADGKALAPLPPWAALWAAWRAARG